MLYISFLSLLTILSSVLVVFFEVTTLTSWLVLGLSIILTLIAKKTVIASEVAMSVTTSNAGHRQNEIASSQSLLAMTRRKFRKYLYPIPYTLYPLAVLIIAFFYSHFQTTSSSPLVWSILPNWFLPAVLILVFITYLPSSVKLDKRFQITQLPNYLITKLQSNSVLYLLSCIIFPLIFLILPVLFPIGTDYDPFVHRAAEQTIVTEGHIQPKTILYSGEYGLVSVISTLTQLRVKQINFFLLPILVILAIPWLLKKTFGNKSLAFFFLLPFSILTTTVPQSLGIFFLLLLLLLVWQEKGGVRQFPHEDCLRQVSPASDQVIAEAEQTKLVAFGEPSFRVGNWSRYTFIRYSLLALASFLCHPFPGIAAFVFLGWNIMYSISQTTITKLQSDEYVALGRLIVQAMLLFLVIIAFIASTIAIPGALILNNNLDSQFAITSINLNPEAYSAIKSIVAPSWIRYTDPLSFIHFFGKNYYLLFFIVILFATVQKIKKTQKPTDPSSSALIEDPETPTPSSGRDSDSDAVFGSERRCRSVGVNNQNKKTSIFSFLDSRWSLSRPKRRGGNDEEEHGNGESFTIPYTLYPIPYLLSFLSIFASSLIVLFYLQPNVTAGEHIQLFTRLFSISLVFLWPLFLNHGSWIMPASPDERASRGGDHGSKKTFHLSFFIFLSVLIVSNIYLQFPHSDRFVNFKGYLTSQDDLATVQQIEERASKPYLVLANQSVGAAALDQFGFSQYVKTRINPGSRSQVWEHYGAGADKNADQRRYDSSTNLYSKPSTLNPQFFYSIPISSQAHRYYLQMTKEPSQKLIDEIFETYEINELYLVLNDYWKISPQSKITLADLADVKQIGSNSVFIFEKK